MKRRVSYRLRLSHTQNRAFLALTQKLPSIIKLLSTQFPASTGVISREYGQGGFPIAGRQTPLPFAYLFEQWARDNRNPSRGAFFLLTLRPHGNQDAARAPSEKDIWSNGAFGNRGFTKWDDMAGKCDAGSPGSDGACAGPAMSKRQRVEWPSRANLRLILTPIGFSLG
jgi:hypothetical protein